MPISNKEAAALKLLQGGIELCPAPFKSVADKCGMSESEVLGLLTRLRGEGVIRRFGAILDHRRAGYTCNALLAWDVREIPSEIVSRLGERAARFDFVSHCYLRDAPGSGTGGTRGLKSAGSTGGADGGSLGGSDWPYQLYTMLHARNEPELTERVEEAYAALRAEAGGCLQKPLVLRTLQEYKKSAMFYF